MSHVICNIRCKRWSVSGRQQRMANTRPVSRQVVVWYFTTQRAWQIEAARCLAAKPRLHSLTARPLSAPSLSRASYQRRRPRTPEQRAAALPQLCPPPPASGRLQRHLRTRALHFAQNTRVRWWCLSEACQDYSNIPIVYLKRTVQRWKCPETWKAGQCGLPQVTPLPAFT